MMTINRDDAQFALDILEATASDKTPHGLDPGYDGCGMARRNILEATRANAMIVALRWMMHRINLDDAKPSDIAPAPGNSQP